MVAVRGIGVSTANLKAMILNAANAAFLSPAGRQKLVNYFTGALKKYNIKE